MTFGSQNMKVQWCTRNVATLNRSRVKVTFLFFGRKYSDMQGSDLIKPKSSPSAEIHDLKSSK